VEIIVSAIITAFIYGIQLFLGMKNFRKEVKKCRDDEDYRNRLIPAKGISPEKIRSKAIQYPGYLLRYTIGGFAITFHLLIFVAVIPRFIFHYYYAFKWILEFISPLLVFYALQWHITRYISGLIDVPTNGENTNIRNTSSTQNTNIQNTLSTRNTNIQDASSTRNTNIRDTSSTQNTNIQDASSTQNTNIQNTSSIRNTNIQNTSSTQNTHSHWKNNLKNNLKNGFKNILQYFILVSSKALQMEYIHKFYTFEFRLLYRYYFLS
jgi:hypothetical protein